MFQDYLFFGVDTKVFYSYRMLHLSHLVAEAKEKHQLNNKRALLLSDALLGCVLLSSVLDYEERINLRIQCGSHFTIGTETTFQAETRGYIECDDSSEIVKNIDEGKATRFDLHIRSLRSQRHNQNLFEGNTISTNSTIEEALNEHLKSSYQMNTRIRIGSWVDTNDGKIHSFGLIYQELPGIPEDVSLKLNQHIDALPSIQSLYSENSDPDVLVKRVIPDETKAIKSLNPKFVCSCSLEKVQAAVSSFPLMDLEDMVAKSENLQVKCHYCNTTHVVHLDQIKNILENVRKHGT